MSRVFVDITGGRPRARKRRPILVGNAVTKGETKMANNKKEIVEVATEIWGSQAKYACGVPCQLCADFGGVDSLPERGEYGILEALIAMKQQKESFGGIA